MSIHLLRDVKIDGVDFKGNAHYEESEISEGEVESLIAAGWAVKSTRPAKKSKKESDLDEDLEDIDDKDEDADPSSLVPPSAPKPPTKPARKKAAVKK